MITIIKKFKKKLRSEETKLHKFVLSGNDIDRPCVWDLPPNIVKLLTPPNSLRLLGAADSGSLQEDEDVPTTCDSAMIGKSRSRHEKFAIFRMTFVFFFFFFMYRYTPSAV